MCFSHHDYTLVSKLVTLTRFPPEELLCKYWTLKAAENRKEIDLARRKGHAFNHRNLWWLRKDSNTGEGRRAGSSLGVPVNFSIKVEDAMLKQRLAAQRMTAMIGWSATAE
jgi:hypothetical protein